MFIRRYFKAFGDEEWKKTTNISLILFFIFLGDAILSFWVPNLVQDTFKDAKLMGMIISFSSLVGLLADMTLPQILKGVTVKKLLISTSILAIAFPLTLFMGVKNPAVFIFLTAMALWGIYYEVIGFSLKQFVADSISVRSRASTWAFIDVFRGLAYFLGPLIAGWIIIKNEILPVPFSIIFVLIGFVMIFYFDKSKGTTSQVSFDEVNLYSELTHWWVLFSKVWPMVIITLVMGLIDATFWTVGAVWTEELARKNFLGGFFLPAYMLPSLFMGFIVARWGIFEGKKKMAEKYLLYSGVFLVAMSLSDFVPLQVLMVLVSSIMLAVSYPMVDAVYSDIVARMGRERKHMIGLSNSSVSLAYIIGPIIAGYMDSQVGSRMTFVTLGGFTIVVALLLLLLTPKKLYLPQSQIKTWND